MKETRKNKALSEAEKRRRAANVRYWAARAAVLMDSLTEDADRLADEMAKAYIQVSSGVTEAINRAKLNFADNFRLTEKEANELLKNADYNKPVSEILKKAAETAKDPGIREKLRAQMSAPAYKYRIDRAQSIADQMRQVTESIAKNQTVEITDFLRTEAEKAYTATVKDLTDEYRLLEEIKQRTRGRMAEAAEQAKALDEEARRTLKEGGKLISEVEALNRKLNELSSGREVGMTFGQIPKSFIEETLKRNWSGEHFSKRVWENTDKLSEELKGILLEHITTGASEYHTGRLVAERFGVAGWKARRLIRTETTYITAAAKIESFMEAGIDEYEYMALIDDRTSDICKELDGKVFKVSEAQTGVNLPPMHPFCRSSIGAHFGDIAENERVGELADKIEVREENIGKGVDNSENGGIIETEEQKKLKEMRENGDITSKINEAVQRRHYRGTNEYNTFLSRGIEKSYFYVPVEDLQSFVDNNMASGKVFLSNNKNEANEVLYYGQTVGYDTKIQKDTSFVKVFYSKERTHLSPYTPANEEG